MAGVAIPFCGRQVFIPETLTFAGGVTGRFLWPGRQHNPGESLEPAASENRRNWSASRNEVHMKLLTGKVALVTGGSRGIGAAIAQRLAADDAAVALTRPAREWRPIHRRRRSPGRRAKAAPIFLTMRV